MALKFVIDTLDEIEPALQAHYVEEHGKFYLATQGDHPKLAEFRAKNVELLKAASKFEGIDPEVVKAERTRIAALEAQVAAAPAQFAELEAQLAAERTARTVAQEKADRSVLQDAIRGKALAAGVLPAALDILLDKAAPVFEVKDGVVQARPNAFSSTRPGELLTPDEWIGEAIREFSFLFAPSTGGGANPRSGGGGTSDGKRVLRNPTPQQLGEHSREIAQGTVRVEYTL